MNNQLKDIEARIQTLIEVHLINYLPAFPPQGKMVKVLADALRASLSTQHLNHPHKTISSGFLLAVHPSRLEEWQKRTPLMESLTEVIQEVSSELGLHFSGTPSLSLTINPSLDVDGFEIYMNQPDRIAQTQNMQTNEKEITIKVAFLIIGGTNVYNLCQTVTNIGRQLDNQIVLDDPRVSRYHAQIRYARNHFIIFDLNSTGGTFINGQRATQSVLYPGDVISLAGLTMVFGQDTPPLSASIEETAPLTPASSERATISLNKPTLKNKNIK